MYFKLTDIAEFGIAAIVWRKIGGLPKIVRILIRQPGISAQRQIAALFPGAVPASCAEIDEVANRLIPTVAGDTVFTTKIVDFTQCSDFQQQLLLAVSGIPRGEVISYQELARRLHRENAARAVGNVLARNPFPLLIPCHRVIRADGSLGGYLGGVDMKIALLKNEGALPCH